MMNKKHMEKVALICEQLQDKVTNYTLESQLATLVNYQCFDCDLFRKKIRVNVMASHITSHAYTDSL